MIEKQTSDFLFGEIDNMLKDIPPEKAQPLQRYLKQLHVIFDSALETAQSKPRSRKKDS